MTDLKLACGRGVPSGKLTSSFNRLILPLPSRKREGMGEGYGVSPSPHPNHKTNRLKSVFRATAANWLSTYAPSTVSTVP